jgi:hypothetical protein
VLQVSYLIYADLSDLYMHLSGTIVPRRAFCGTYLFANGKWISYILVAKELALTSRDVNEVLPGRLVDLDVPVADVVLVSLERHLAVSRVLKEDECLAVATALRRQAQSDTAPDKKNVCNLVLPSG